MRVAPICPQCGHVEWLGDGLFISQERAAATVRRLVVASRPERRWSCMVCWHEVPRPSELDTTLEEIAAAGEAGAAGPKPESAETARTV